MTADPSLPAPTAAKTATVALILGLAALPLALLPIAGVPVSICGLVQGLRAWRASHQRKAMAAIVLSIVALLLALANAAAGLYLGVHAPRAQ